MTSGRRRLLRRLAVGVGALLARSGAHATFFLIGDRAEAHPEMVERIRSTGHEVGNHHYSLRSTLRLTDVEYVDGLRRGRRKGLRFVSIGTLLASR